MVNELKKQRQKKSDCKKLRWGFVLFALLIVSPSFGQLKIFPLNEQAPSNVKKNYSAARLKQTAPLELPFWDDFSAPVGNYPDTMKWINSYSIWVNDGMAINQPTINVATFDGLDSIGVAYNPTEVLVTGYTDVLTSAEINLSESGVTPEERSSVYLSFFFQWQGNGEAPDSDDFLELEFKNSENAWESILSIFPEADFDRTKFYDTLFQIQGDQFFHERFQFRFRSFGRQSGPYDTWNLDYIYLNKNRFISDISFPDRAAASQPGSLFDYYTAIPYKHFKSNAIIDTIEFDVQNLKDAEVSSVIYNVEGTFTNYFKNDTTTYSTLLLEERGVKGESGALAAYERVHVEYDRSLPDPDNALQFNPEAEAVDVTLKIIVISGDESDTDKNKFQPIDLRVNDTITSTFQLRDYYAYDDGVAEYSAGLIEAGNLIAYRFDMLTSEPDTLIGFNISFAPYAVANNQTVTFYIYHEENGKPGKVWETIPSQRIERKGLNEFQTISWLPAILIDEPSFYIGWKQPVIGKVLVGLDVDNDSGDRIFVNTTTSWYQNQVVKGSLMIRPLFGKGVVEVIDGIEDEITHSIFPNPNQGNFYIDGTFDSINIYSLNGAEMSYQSERLNHHRTLITLNKIPGLYFLQIFYKDAVRSHKILITP